MEPKLSNLREIRRHLASNSQARALANEISNQVFRLGVDRRFGCFPSKADVPVVLAGQIEQFRQLMPNVLPVDLARECQKMSDASLYREVITPMLIELLEPHLRPSVSP